MGVLPVPPSVRLPTLMTGTLDAVNGRLAAIVAAVAHGDRERVRHFGGSQHAAHCRRAEPAAPAADKIAKFGGAKHRQPVASRSGTA